MAYVFGVATAPGSYGKIQNYSAKSAVEIGEYRDENGHVAGYTAYNKTQECSFEYVFDGTEPTVGTVLTVGSDKFVVTSCDLTESNTDYKRMSCTGRRWINNTIPATT
jgi:hypothetical protein